MRADVLCIINEPLVIVHSKNSSSHLKKYFDFEFLYLMYNLYILEKKVYFSLETNYFIDVSVKMVLYRNIKEKK